MRVTIITPDTLTVISNGRLVRQSYLENRRAEYIWFVDNPINNYGVSFYVASYTLIKDSYKGINGELDLSYYVLDYNKEKALSHFEQVKPMLNIYEKYFGAYPFYKDGYKLVESSYWGMEHQSAIAYGNNYVNNIWGFDYIIIHESGHEWFGNSLSCTDNAELWLHESFTTYSEAVYVEEMFGMSVAQKFLQEYKRNIQNDAPLVGQFGVNDTHTEDIYGKGACMLHTLRHIINNDQLWFKILYEYATHFKKSSVTTNDFVHLVNNLTHKDFEWFFDQYLNNESIPIFYYQIKKEKKGVYVIRYKLDSDVGDFEMLIPYTVVDRKKKLKANAKWNSVTVNVRRAEEIKFNLDDYLVKIKKMQKK
jgi:aminopeptidase N